ncbi:MAG: hypothetical protein AAFV43_02915 [Planctomycetota bacterium]
MPMRQGFASGVAAFVTAASLLLSAATASAQSVSLSVRSVGGDPDLDTNGDWVWDVFYNTDASGGSAAIELGFTFAGANLQSGEVTPTGFDGGGVEVANPAPAIFGWETPGLTGFPEGLQIDLSEGLAGEAFYAFGTGILAGSSSQLLGSFTTEGPRLGSLSSVISVVGAYNQFGNLAGTLPGTHGAVFNNVGPTVVNPVNAVTAKAGDIDLDDFVDSTDASVLTTNFGSPVTNGWAGGDLDGNAVVDFADVFAFSPTFEESTGPSGSGVEFQYNPSTGEVTLLPNGNDVGLIRLGSSSGAFTGAAATLPGGSFATDTDSLVGVVIDTGAGGDVTTDVSLGNILPSGLTEAFLLSDLELDWSGGFGTPNETAALAIGVPGFLPGDFSGDGRVDNDDLNLLLPGWGSTVPPSPAGWVGFQPTAPIVDNDELNALLVNWGAGTGSSVPEPTALLLAMAGVALLRRR